MQRTQYLTDTTPPQRTISRSHSVERREALRASYGTTASCNRRPSPVELLTEDALLRALFPK